MRSYIERPSFIASLTGVSAHDWIEAHPILTIELGTAVVMLLVSLILHASPWADVHPYGAFWSLLGSCSFMAFSVFHVICIF